MKGLQSIRKAGAANTTSSDRKGGNKLTNLKKIPVNTRKFGDYCFDYLSTCKHNLNRNEGKACPLCKLANMTIYTMFEEERKLREQSRLISNHNRAILRTSLLYQWSLQQPLHYAHLYYDLDPYYEITWSKSLTQLLNRQESYLLSQLQHGHHDNNKKGFHFEELLSILQRRNRIYEVGYFAAIYLQARIRAYLSRRRTRRMLLTRFEYIIPPTTAANIQTEDNQRNRPAKQPYYYDNFKQRKWARYPLLLTTPPMAIRMVQEQVIEQERLDAKAAATKDSDTATIGSATTINLASIEPPGTPRTINRRIHHEEIQREKSYSHYIQAMMKEKARILEKLPEEERGQYELAEQQQQLKQQQLMQQQLMKKQTTAGNGNAAGNGAVSVAGTGAGTGATATTSAVTIESARIAATKKGNPNSSHSSNSHNSGSSFIEQEEKLIHLYVQLILFHDLLAIYMFKQHRFSSSSSTSSVSDPAASTNSSSNSMMWFLPSVPGISSRALGMALALLQTPPPSMISNSTATMITSTLLSSSSSSAATNTASATATTATNTATSDGQPAASNGGQQPVMLLSNAIFYRALQVLEQAAMMSLVVTSPEELITKLCSVHELYDSYDTLLNIVYPANEEAEQVEQQLSGSANEQDVSQQQEQQQRPYRVWDGTYDTSALLPMTDYTVIPIGSSTTTGTMADGMMVMAADGPLPSTVNATEPNKGIAGTGTVVTSTTAASSVATTTAAADLSPSLLPQPQPSSSRPGSASGSTATASAGITSLPQEILPFGIHLRPFHPTLTSSTATPASSSASSAPPVISAGGYFRLFFYEEEFIAISSFSPYVYYPEVYMQRDSILASIKKWIVAPSLAASGGSGSNRIKAMMKEYYRQVNTQNGIKKQAAATAQANAAAAAIALAAQSATSNTDVGERSPSPATTKNRRGSVVGGGAGAAALNKNKSTRTLNTPTSAAIVDTSASADHHHHGRNTHQQQQQQLWRSAFVPPADRIFPSLSSQITSSSSTNSSNSNQQQPTVGNSGQQQPAAAAIVGIHEHMILHPLDNISLSDCQVLALVKRYSNTTSTAAASSQQQQVIGFLKYNHAFMDRYKRVLNNENRRNTRSGTGGTSGTGKGSSNNNYNNVGLEFKLYKEEDVEAALTAADHSVNTGAVTSNAATSLKGRINQLQIPTRPIVFNMTLKAYPTLPHYYRPYYLHKEIIQEAEADFIAAFRSSRKGTTTTTTALALKGTQVYSLANQFLGITMGSGGTAGGGTAGGGSTAGGTASGGRKNSMLGTPSTAVAAGIAAVASSGSASGSAVTASGSAGSGTVGSPGSAGAGIVTGSNEPPTYQYSEEEKYLMALFQHSVGIDTAILPRIRLVPPSATAAATASGLAASATSGGGKGAGSSSAASKSSSIPTNHTNVFTDAQLFIVDIYVHLPARPAQPPSSRQGPRRLAGSSSADQQPSSAGGNVARSLLDSRGSSGDRGGGGPINHDLPISIHHIQGMFTCEPAKPPTNFDGGLFDYDYFHAIYTQQQQQQLWQQQQAYLQEQQAAGMVDVTSVSNSSGGMSPTRMNSLRSMNSSNTSASNNANTGLPAGALSGGMTINTSLGAGGGGGTLSGTNSLVPTPTAASLSGNNNNNRPIVGWSAPKANSGLVICSHPLASSQATPGGSGMAVPGREFQFRILGNNPNREYLEKILPKKVKRWLGLPV